MIKSPKRKRAERARKPHRHPVHIKGSEATDETANEEALKRHWLPDKSEFRSSLSQREGVREEKMAMTAIFRVSPQDWRQDVANTV